MDTVYVNGFFKGEGKNVQHRNWGDELNFLFLDDIFNEVGLKKYEKQDKPYFLLVGSLIENAYIVNDKCSIWGSGIPHANFPLKYKPEKIYAVRGPISRQFLLKQGIECPEVYGDPALLIPYYYKPDIKKQYKIGIIPHWQTKPENFLSDGIIKDPEIKIINMGCYNKWTDIIDEILSCEYIVSESLHGLILAEAYGIPNVWAYMRFLSQKIKFYDFFLSLDKKGGAFRENFYTITKNTTKQELLEECKKYKHCNTLDLQPLIDACPFKIKAKM